jgi:hypothetical protein
MKPQHHQPRNDTSSRNELFADGGLNDAQQAWQDIQREPPLQKSFTDLGFDLDSVLPIHAAFAGPVSTLTCLDRLFAPGDPFSVEYRFIIAPSDRDADILYPGEMTRPDRKVIAIQTAGIHTIDPGERDPRCILERTYAIGSGPLPHRTVMMADVVEAERAYLRQFRNILKFLQAAQPVLNASPKRSSPN